MEATVQRIKHLVNPPRIFSKLPTDVLASIFRFLPVRALRKIALLNKDGARQANRAKVERAREFGCKENDPAKADEHLCSLLPFIELVEKHTVREGRPWKLDVESSLEILQKNSPPIPASLRKMAEKYQDSPELLKTALLLYSQDPFHNKSSLLQDAAACCFEEIVDLALTLGAPVNLRGSHGAPPLCSALFRRKGRSEKEVEKTVEILLNKGADVTLSTAKGNLPLHLAAEAGYAAIVDLLIRKGSPVNQREHAGLTPLCSALLIQDGRSEEDIEETVEILLKEGADPSIPTDKGNLPIHLAAQSGYAKMVNLLIAYKADVNLQGYKKMPALSWALAARKGRSERDIAPTVENLLQAGADLSIPAENGATALHFAAMSGYANIVSRLIARGADVHCQDHEGLTPLDWARQKRLGSPTQQTIEILLKAGVASAP